MSPQAGSGPSCGAGNFSSKTVTSQSLALIAAFLLVLPAAAAATGSAVARPGVRFETERSFVFGPGRETRTFTFRERSGVILVNELTVPHGVRAVAVEEIPHLAGARVISWPDPNDPSLACSTTGATELCAQGEEWCPMPRATWKIQLTKLSGPAGTILLDYLVAPPPDQG